MTAEEKHKEFISKLKDLFIEYKAIIVSDCDMTFKDKLRITTLLDGDVQNTMLDQPFIDYDTLREIENELNSEMTIDEYLESKRDKR